MLKCITFDGDTSTLNTLMGYFEKLDKALADVHQALSKEQTERPIFVREEVEWIRKRDLAADKASAKSNSTPSQSIEYVRTSASVTMDRCYELLENYGDYLEPEKN